MKDELLDELEQTAQRCGVRVALLCAYQIGQADAHKVDFRDIVAPGLIQKEASNV